ncbi:MAG: hypothetical protein IE909_01825 [Campylobacterales bacterium]|nr:hypothetical protein [Campylobacterales bacterium]
MDITGENYLIGFDSILRSDLRSTNDKETTSEVGIKKLYSSILEKAKTNNFKQGEMISQDYDK